MMRETGMLLDFFLDGSFSHAYLTLRYRDYSETDTSELIQACHQLFHASIAKHLRYYPIGSSCSRLVSSIKIMRFIGPAGHIVLRISIEYR